MAEPMPTCSCSHSVHCVCGCHARNCDPSEDACDLDFLPDEGGLTRWGCAVCSPGQGAPHLVTCAVAVVATARPDVRGFGASLPTQ